MSDVQNAVKGQSSFDGLGVDPQASAVSGIAIN